MLKSLTILGILLAVSVTAGSVYSQAKMRTGSKACKIKVKDAPKLNGYYLGQDSYSVSSDLSQPTTSMVKVSGVQDSTSATAENSARQIRWMSSGGKITSVIMHFVGYQPKAIENFVADFSKLTNIESEMFATYTDRQALLRCNGFAIYLTILPTDQEKYVIPMVRMEKYIEPDIPKADRPRGAPLDGERERIARDKAAFERNPRKHVDGGRGPTVGP